MLLGEYEAMCRALFFAVPFLLALTPASLLARSKSAALCKAESAGVLVAADEAGQFQRIAGTKARMKCVGPKELGRHFNRWCSSSSVVEQDGTY